MRRLLLALTTVSLLAACGGGDGTTNPPPGTPGITLAASSSAGTVARGASTTTTLTLGRVDGFTGAVALTAEGLPAGVTVAFAPQSLTGTTLSSTATITVANTAVAGASTITIRAAGTGVTDKTVQFVLTIPTPAITVSAGTGAVTAVQGTAVTVPITITRINGASGNVTLTAEGLPANVTAAFAPAAIADGATTSTLTLTVGALATAAVSNVTVRAASTGAVDQTATIALTVTSAAVPAFTLTAAPAALSVVAGQSGNSVLTITKTGGFAANVALTLEGAPAGVTGTFAPNPATGTTSTLTISSTLGTVPGTYNLTVRGTSAGLTDRTTVIAFTVTAVPGVTLAIAPTALTIAQGATGQSVITLTRLGGLAGDVNLTATSAAGITTAFAPAAVAGTSSTLTVTVGGAAALGASNVVITATGVGGVTANITLPVTVVVAAGYTLTATSASVALNALATSTVTITRTGGFAGAVDLTATGVPANVTAAFSPASAPAGASTLTFTAAANAAPGTYTVTVVGTVAGLANQTTTLTLTITGAGGGNIAWRFCDPARVPSWFAYRDGSSGTWTRVLAGANNTFTFTIAQSVGSVVYVIPIQGGSPQINQFMNTSAELTAIATAECTSNPAGKSLTGTVAGLSAGQVANVGVGGALAPTINFPLSAFSLTNVDDVTTDLLAFRATQTFAGNAITITPDKGILRRSVNYPANSVIPVLDFNAAESFVPASGTLTVANSNAESLLIGTQFITGNGTSGTFLFGAFPLTGTTTTVYGVPSSRTQAGDYHVTLVTSGDVASQRLIAQYNRDVASRTLTLGAILNAPTLSTTATAPYARIRSRGNWQAEYGEAVGVTFSQQAGGGRNWTIAASRGYFGGAAAEYDLEIPDLSAVGGFSNSWALASGASTTASTSALSVSTSGNFTITEGLSFKQASRTQNITP